MPLTPSRFFGEAEAPEDTRGSLPKAAALNVGVSTLRNVVAPAAELAGVVTGPVPGIDPESPNFFKDVAQGAREGANRVEQRIPAGRIADRDAAVFPGPDEQSTFENFGSSAVMKLSSFIPAAAPYVAAGPVGAPIVGAALGAGQRISDVKDEIAKASDVELEQRHPSFAEDIKMGLPPKEARKLLLDKMTSAGNMALSTVGGAAGAAPIGRAFMPVGGKGVGFLRNVGVHALEGAAGGAAQGVAMDVARQEGYNATGAQVGYDVEEAMRAALNAAGETAIFAGGMGTVPGARGTLNNWATKRLEDAKNRPQDAAPPGKPIQQVTVPPDQAAALGKTPEAPSSSLSSLDAQIAAVPPEVIETKTPPNVPGAEVKPAPIQPSTGVSAAATPGVAVADAAAKPTDTVLQGSATSSVTSSLNMEDIIRGATTKRTKFTDLQRIVAEAHAAVGELPPKVQDFNAALQKLVQAGEISRSAKYGYKNTRVPEVAAKPAEVVKPAEPIVERTVPPEIPAELPSVAELPKVEPVRPPEITPPVTAPKKPSRELALADAGLPNVKKKDLEAHLATVPLDQLRVAEGKLRQAEDDAVKQSEVAQKAGDTETSNELFKIAERIADVADEVEMSRIEKERATENSAAEVVPSKVEFSTPTAETKPKAPPRAPTELEAQVAKVLGPKVKPEGSTVQKVARKIKKKVEVTKAQLDAKKAAEQAELKRRRDAGETIVFKQDNTLKNTVEDATKEAVAEVKKTDAERKAAMRKKIQEAQEAKAKKTLNEFWATDDAETAATIAKALGGDADAKRAVVGRIKNMIRVAHNEGLADAVTSDGKAPRVAVGRRAGGEGDVPAPYKSFIGWAERVIKKIDKKEIDTNELSSYIIAEQALRSGDAGTAHLKRLFDSEELTKAQKEAKRGEDNEPDFDAAKKKEIQQEGKNTEEDNIIALIDAGKPRAKDKAAANETDQTGLLTEALAGPVKYTRQKIKDLVGKRKFDFGTGAVAFQFNRRMAAIRDRVLSIAGDVDVRVVPEELFAKYGYARTDGLYYSPNDEGLRRGHKGIILLTEYGATHDITPLHEAVHAATEVAMMLDPKLRQAVKDIMDDVMTTLSNKDYELAKEIGREYGFTNESEFLAEAFSNPEFQSILQAIPLSKPMATRWGKVRNAWDAFVKTVAKWIGVTRADEVNALEAAMKVGSDAMDAQLVIREHMRQGGDIASVPQAEPRASITREQIVEGARERLPTGFDLRAGKQRILDKLATFTQLANNSDKLFGENKPARAMADAMQRMATEKDKIYREKGAPLVQKLYDAERAFTASGQWENFVRIVHDATVNNVYPDRPLDANEHLGKGPADWHAKASHAELQRRYDELPPRLKELYGEATGYFKATQREMALSNIEKTLRAISDDGKGSSALAQRVLDRKMTDADRKVLGEENTKIVEKSRQLASQGGPYAPLMRHGDYVVEGKYVIKTPAGATRMNGKEEITDKGNVFEFKDEAAAKSFVSNLGGLVPESVRKVYVDPETGSRWGKDADGKVRKLTSEETNAETRYRVAIQDKHVSFHERSRDALATKQELIRQGLEDVSFDGKRADAPSMRNRFMPQEMQNMLNSIQKRTGFKEMSPAAQKELIHTLTIQIYANIGRVQAHRIPRRNIAGYSLDLSRNAEHYASSTSGYIARNKYQPTVDKYLKEMEDYTSSTRTQGDDALQLKRRQRLTEMQRRVYAEGEPEPHSLFHKTVNRILQLSYLDKLASPAFHVINSMEPWTVSLPTLAGKYGFVPTMRALNEAYGLIGAKGMVGAGIRDTGRAATKSYVNAEGLTDYMASMKNRLRGAPDGADLSQLLDHLSDVGLLSRDAGMELGRLVEPGATLVGRGLDRADLMARQLGTAIENINRSVTGIAAYKLERASGSSHQKAIEAASEQVHDTMGDYSQWNAAPLFKHPIGRLALQFKKYAQKTYYLLGKQASAALKGDGPEQIAAMKSFAGLMATHTLTAGVLGLPLEAIKLAMVGAGLAGVTDKKYEDLEQSIRKGGAAVLGKDMGEIMTRGLPRWLGIDLASRVSLNSLITNNEPKSMKRDDLMTWLATNFAGAPAGLMLDAVDGFQALSKGDVIEATRLLMPLKIYADSVQAFQMVVNGKKSETGRVLQEPWRIDQGIIKALGFQPGAVAEQQEQSFAIRGDQKAFAKKRQNMVNDWVTATPAEKSAQWQQIQRWNESQPAPARVTYLELTRAMQRRQTEASKQDYSKGIRTTKRDRHLRSENEFYNTSP